MEWIVEKLIEAFDYIIGSLLLIVTSVFTGFASIVENLISDIGKWITGMDFFITIEDVIFNKVPYLDVNAFNMESAGGVLFSAMPITNGITVGGKTVSVIQVFRQTIATWYYTLRNITAAGLLLTLIYMGIRMAMSTVTKKRVKYNKMIVNWAISLVIVFTIHYLMIVVINLNETAIGFLKNSFSQQNGVYQGDGGDLRNGETSIYDTVKSQAYDLRASVNLPATVMYMIMVYLLIKFILMYAKRFLVVNVLTLMAPVVAIGYSIDKIKDGKSQSLSNWAKEYTYNVIVQTVHALLYTMFFTMALNVAGASIIGVIFAFIILNFMLKAEALIKKIFGIKSGSLKDLLATAAGMTGAVMAVGALARTQTALNRKMHISPVKGGAKMIRNFGMQLKEQGGLRGQNIPANPHIKNNAEKAEGKLKTTDIIDAWGDPNKINPTLEMAKGLASSLKGQAKIAAAIPLLIMEPGMGIERMASGVADVSTSFDIKEKDPYRADEEEEDEFAGAARPRLKRFAKNLRNGALSVATGGAYSTFKNAAKAGKDLSKLTSREKDIRAELKDIAEQEDQFADVLDGLRRADVAAYKFINSRLKGQAKKRFNPSDLRKAIVDEVVRKASFDIEDLDRVIKKVNAGGKGQLTQKLKVNVRQVIQDRMTAGTLISAVSSTTVDEAYADMNREELTEIIEEAAYLPGSIRTPSYIDEKDIKEMLMEMEDITSGQDLPKVLTSIEKGLKDAVLPKGVLGALAGRIMASEGLASRKDAIDRFLTYDRKEQELQLAGAIESMGGLREGRVAKGFISLQVGQTITKKGKISYNDIGELIKGMNRNLAEVQIRESVAQSNLDRILTKRVAVKLGLSRREERTVTDAQRRQMFNRMKTKDKVEVLKRAINCSGSETTKLKEAVFDLAEPPEFASLDGAVDAIRGHQEELARLKFTQYNVDSAVKNIVEDIEAKIKKEARRN